MSSRRTSNAPVRCESQSTSTPLKKNISTPPRSRRISLVPTESSIHSCGSKRTSCANTPPSSFLTSNGLKYIGPTDDGEELMLEQHNWMGSRKAESGGHLTYTRPEELPDAHLRFNTFAVRKEVSEEARLLMRKLGKKLDDDEVEEDTEPPLSSVSTPSSEIAKCDKSSNEDEQEQNGKPSPSGNEVVRVVCSCGIERYETVDCVSCEALGLIKLAKDYADNLEIESVAQLEEIMRTANEAACVLWESQQRMRSHQHTQLLDSEFRAREDIQSEEKLRWRELLVNLEGIHRVFVSKMESDAMTVVLCQQRAEFRKIPPKLQTSEKVDVALHTAEGHGKLSSEAKVQKGCCAVM